MKRKMLCFLLIAVMSVSLLGGCGNADEPSDTVNEPATKDTAETEGSQAVSNAGDINFDEEPYTLNVPLLVFGGSQADVQLVQDEINQHILDKINVQIELEPVSAVDLMNVYTLKASSNEKLDLIHIIPVANTFMPVVNSNMIMPLDDLVAEWGQGISDNLGDAIKVGMLNNKLYTLTVQDGAVTTTSCLWFNLELVEKYGLEDEINNLKDISDIEPMLALMKENEPSVIPFSSENSSMGYTNMMKGVVYDSLGDGYGSINIESDDTYKVLNYYESEDFMSKCKLMRDWYVKGYISKDTLTSQETGGDMLKAGKVFCTNGMASPVGESPNGYKISWILGRQQAMSTSDYSHDAWAISSSCERPDKAMQFLNLLYTDSTLITLMQRGIEGKHYTLTADNCAVIIEESGYSMGLGQVGDHRVMPPAVNSGADYWERLAIAEQETIYSPAFGFRFDATNYANALAACDAVKAEYYSVIDCGAVDPEVEIPKFLEALKAAGIDTLIAAKQEQLDAWVAVNGK